jgi:hypothetical protein
MTKFTGTPPKGSDLMATLIRLLEEQEGVKITYQIEKGRNDNGE